jgi:uncharacterized RDD family membrane protein YckC
MIYEECRVMSHKYRKTIEQKNKDLKETPPEAPKLYDLAELGRRAIAYGIDVVLVALPFGIVMTSIYGSMGILSVIPFIISCLLFFVYFFSSLYFLQQSPGQAILKLYVMPVEALNITEARKSGTKLTIKQATLHALGKIHPVIMFIDFLIGVILRKGKQEPSTLFQIFADTVVVQEAEPAKLRKSALK